MGVLVEDTFTEASNIDLASHTPSPTGTAWAELEDTAGTLTIDILASTDTVKASANDADDRILYDCTPAATAADADVEATLTAIPGSGQARSFFLFGREADASNLLGVLTFIGASAADKKLFEKVSGTPAELASGDNGTTAGDKLKLEVRGTTAKLFHDTGGGFSEILSATTAVIAAGKGGLGFGNILTSTDDINVNWRIDDFKLTEFASGGASVAITAARMTFGRPVAFATNVLVKRGTFLSGSPVIFTHIINIGKGILNLVGKNILLREGVQIGKGILNFGRPVTFTVGAISKIYRLSIGRGVSFIKGVGSKKVGKEDVSKITNPEDQ